MSTDASQPVVATPHGSELRDFWIGRVDAASCHGSETVAIYATQERRQRPKSRIGSEADRQCVHHRQPGAQRHAMAAAGRRIRG